MPTLHDRKSDRTEMLRKQLTDNPDKQVSIESLAKKYGVSSFTIKRDVREMAKDDENITMALGFVLYSTPDRYGAHKNPEGYSDSTAAKAIIGRTPMNDIELDTVTSEAWMPLPGEVWNVKSSKGTGIEEEVLVIAINADCNFATCIAYSDGVYDSCNRLYSKPFKYFTTKIEDVEKDTMSYILSTIGDYLGIKAPDPVEKIVEVPVEVEKVVEVPVHGDYTKAEVDALLSEQKAAIYEECFKLLAKTR